MHRITLRKLAVSAAALSLVAGAAAFRGSDHSLGSSRAAYSTDEEVVAFLIQANQDEIRQARGILVTTRNAEVKAFAERMVNDHGQALTKVRAIGKRLGFAEADSMAARPDMAVPSNDSMPDHGDSTRVHQMPKTGDSSSVSTRPYPRTDDSTGVSAGPHGADHAYVDGQVGAHQQVLEKLQAAAPGIKDTELRKFVGDVQKTVKAHLTEAKRLEGVLKRTST